VNNLDLELAFGQALNLDSTQVFHTLLLSLVLGLLVSFVYKLTLSGKLVHPAVQLTLVMLAMVGAMVMMVIGNNVARAFSLVGALAIIRFRTRLRSPWDITFVFFSLAVGIACGVLAYRVAVVGTVFICLASLALQALPVLGMKGELRALRIDLAAYEGAEQRINEVLARHLRRKWLEEARSYRFGETLSFRYRVVLKDDLAHQVLLQQLSMLDGVERVMLYADSPAPSSSA
jgi:uncharacterized membrane protein YhiD involved in acid resistance